MKPSLSSERTQDGVVFSDIVGVVPLRVLFGGSGEVSGPHDPTQRPATSCKMGIQQKKRENTSS